MRVVTGNNNGNPGIVPPWLKTIAAASEGEKNPGIVPPWLQPPHATTAFVREPADLSPPLVGGYRCFS